MALLYSLVNSTAHMYGGDFRNLLFLMLNYDYKARIDFKHLLEFSRLPQNYLDDQGEDDEEIPL